METFSQGLLSILVMVSMAGCLARTPTTEPTFAVFEEQNTEVDETGEDTGHVAPSFEGP